MKYNIWQSKLKNIVYENFHAHFQAVMIMVMFLFVPLKEDKWSEHLHCQDGKLSSAQKVWTEIEVASCNTCFHTRCHSQYINARPKAANIWIWEHLKKISNVCIGPGSKLCPDLRENPPSFSHCVWNCPVCHSCTVTFSFCCSPLVQKFPLCLRWPTVPTRLMDKNLVTSLEV